MVELAIERPTRASKTMPTGATEVSVGLTLLLAETARVAAEEAIIDAESILEQAQEANALDPVG